MEATTKKWRTEKLKNKKGYAQKYRQTVHGIRGVSLEEDKKLSYRRGTVRCIVSFEILPLPRSSAETTCTRSPEQIEVMKLEG